MIRFVRNFILHILISMTIKQERIQEVIREIASRQVTSWSQNFEHDFGIVSITDVELSSDRSYADIFLSASEQTE